jgi:hypothetical protein
MSFFFALGPQEEQNGKEWKIELIEIVAQIAGVRIVR